MVVTHQDDRYDQFIYRIAQNEQDVRSLRDVASPDIDFVSLPSGVCVWRRDNDSIELFATRPGRDRSRVIEDAALGASSSLAHHGSRVLMSRGRSLLHMTMA
jgi:hypothetical protein